LFTVKFGFAFTTTVVEADELHPVPEFVRTTV
jgi:hypothetical protein